LFQQQQLHENKKHIQRFEGVKATFMVVEVMAPVNNSSVVYSIEDISVDGKGDARSFMCPKVTWKLLDFNPNLYLGECQRLDPIHGQMMRIWNRYEWSSDLKEAHIPFIDAVRSIVLSPFVILMFGVVAYVGVQITVALLEYALILAGMIRKHTYVEVPAVLMSDTVREGNEEKVEVNSVSFNKSPRSRRSENTDDIIMTRPTRLGLNQSVRQLSRRASFGSNRSKEVAIMELDSRMTESMKSSFARPTSGESIAMVELNTGMNRSFRNSSPNRSNVA